MASSKTDWTILQSSCTGNCTAQEFAKQVVLLFPHSSSMEGRKVLVIHGSKNWSVYTLSVVYAGIGLSQWYSCMLYKPSSIQLSWIHTPFCFPQSWDGSSLKNIIQASCKLIWDGLSTFQHTWSCYIHLEDMHQSLTCMLSRFDLVKVARLKQKFWITKVA